jgi:hypothetical protein
MVGATARLGAPVLVSIMSIQAGIWIAPFLHGILAPELPPGGWRQFGLRQLSKSGHFTNQLWQKI